jgi:hypothetical protein
MKAIRRWMHPADGLHHFHEDARTVTHRKKVIEKKLLTPCSFTVKKKSNSI